ncbi:MAG TPA: PilZ domain-containing protein [Candidatus Hydrogenedentes bacterium]|nr:PilZ domain-containing protein [Candidatus Hydrogenedentota bacterium]HNT87031.1 PilZ domain-containing protein [Candidatus Hydrogenedentota bacterium]
MASYLEPGRRVTLCLAERRVPSRILAVAQDTVGVTMDTPPYPDEGAGVGLEFEGPDGAVSYYTRVIVCPRAPGDAMILMRAPNISGAERRRAWRVPLDLRAPVRRVAAGKAADMRVVNISTEGALLEPEAALELHEVLDIYLALPGQDPHLVRARVVREEASPKRRPRSLRFGVLFADLAPDARRTLTYFMWERLIKLYPKEMAKLFPGGKAYRKLQGRKRKDERDQRGQRDERAGEPEAP